ncbi:unnamed protein product [Ambrosiozyma monospora]|uniref:Unnamed protein product n=1 Tax=Ambrosiozyma monospora TaxID=43982 RepID=A0ACB5UBI0_AMBMO|nr:unnamed protein product [Ambrosiozyma monospora]
MKVTLKKQLLSLMNIPPTLMTGENDTPVASNTGSSSSSSSSSDTQFQPNPTLRQDQKKTKREQTFILHIPVVMPCGHIFGRSCLREWLKTHSSCPLCRNKITSSGSRNNDPLGNGATITLPNLARVISQSQSAISQFNERPMSFIMPEQNAEFQADEVFGDQVTVPLTNALTHLDNLAQANRLNRNGAVNGANDNASANGGC